MGKELFERLGQRDRRLARRPAQEPGGQAAPRPQPRTTRLLLEDLLDRYEYLEMKGFVREKVMTASLESVYVPLFTQADRARPGRAGAAAAASWAACWCARRRASRRRSPRCCPATAAW